MGVPVSVMMPCYNAARTLGLALSSLLAQTYVDWECIVVDDGSVDQPAEIVARLADSRIRIVRLEKRGGRGAARQAALERSGGDLLCMLDADDWYFPEKLERQVEALSADPKLGLVSARMAVVGPSQDLTGTWQNSTSDGAVRGPWQQLRVPFAAPPTMMRAELAKHQRYDSDLGRSEDIDFLFRVLRNQRFQVLATPMYAYREEYVRSAEAKTLTGLRFERRYFRKHWRQFPLASPSARLASLSKSAAYRALFSLGLGRRVIERRWHPATLEEQVDFDRARQCVAAIAVRHFPERPWLLAEKAEEF